MFENAKANGILELIDTDLVFDNESTNKIKMNHIKTDDLEIVFRMDSGYFDEEIIETIVSWDKDRRFVVSRVLTPEKERDQLSLLDGDEYEYFFFVTNTELPSEKVVISYEKRGNAENYIKEAKYDIAVGHLLLKSFWANEAVFQMMMLSYNLFLLFKFDFLGNS